MMWVFLGIIAVQGTFKAQALPLNQAVQTNNPWLTVAQTAAIQGGAVAVKGAVQQVTVPIHPQVIPVPVQHLLSRTTRGSELLHEFFKSQVQVESGSVSRTEFTALRRVSDPAPRGWKIVIHLNTSKDDIDQALDLAHELTHALSPRLNPYDPNLTLEGYVEHGIEGPGGEADAIMTECVVGQQLMNSVDVSDRERIRRRCLTAWNAVEDRSDAKKNKNRIASLTEEKKENWKKSFYAVGEYFGIAKHWLRHVSSLSQESPQFISAMAKRPYPLALIEEYLGISRALCTRVTDRIASGSASVLDHDFLRKRCANLFQ